MTLAIRFKNHAFTCAGLGFLALAKLQHLLRGYKTPRPFSPADAERTVAYDLRVVEEWERALEQYGVGPGTFVGRSILELGPGPDLGVGVTLLAKGAASYAAMDVHRLAFDAHPAFYERLFQSLDLDHEAATALQADIRAAQNERPTRRLEYLVRKDFDLPAAFAGRKFDLFVSQAAFEHFDDVERTIQDLSTLAADNARLVFGVDLKTHSRWISERDPLNIYRYGDGLYRALSFKGSPNRVPLSSYVKALTEAGWTDIRTFDEVAVDEADFAAVKSHLHPRYRQDENRYLWVVLCARRGGAASPASA
jgi:SAM-dependent methyltransferase